MMLVCRSDGRSATSFKVSINAEKNAVHSIKSIVNNQLAIALSSSGLFLEMHNEI